MRWIALLFALSLSGAAVGADSLAVQRQRFAEAEQALERNDLPAFERLLPRLKDYPLYLYLRHAQAQHALPGMSAAEVAAAQDEFRGSLYEDLLLKGWLHVLAERQQWQDFLAQYRPIGQDTAVECRHAEALAASGDTAAAWRKFETLWLRGRALPDDCDTVLSAWKRAGQQTEERVWRRFELALEARNPQFARGLAAQLPKERQTYAERWLEVHDSPAKVLHKSWFPGKDAVEQAILSHGIQRLAGRDVEDAEDAWAALRHRPFTDAQRAQIEQRLALRRATQRKPGALAALEALPETGLNRELREWGLRAALLAQDWDAVLRWHARLEPAQTQEDRWRYWRARADDAQGRTEAARAQYLALAAGRGYHAFLAADRLGAAYPIVHQPLPVSAEELARFAQASGMHRVLEWHALDRLPQARREWQHILQQQGDEGRLKMAKLLQQAGWHSQAIFTTARVDRTDDLELRFPVLFREGIEREAASQALDPALMLAVVRQESAFQHDAKSPVGATGLMQIMPATGRLIARALNTAAPKGEALSGPDLNLRFGAWYLSDLLRRFGGHQPLALAGYNAGPHRAQKWRPDNEALEASLWAELIPFNETRGYVQRILSYSAIYEHRLGRGITPLPRRMPPVTPPGGGMVDTAPEETASTSG
jgi:soluble lytic murein transglycosylase